MNICAWCWKVYTVSSHHSSVHHSMTLIRLWASLGYSSSACHCCNDVFSDLFWRNIKVRQIFKPSSWKVYSDVVSSLFWAETFCLKAPTYVFVAFIFLFKSLSASQSVIRMKHDTDWFVMELFLCSACRFTKMVWHAETWKMLFNLSIGSIKHTILQFIPNRKSPPISQALVCIHGWQQPQNIDFSSDWTHGGQHISG